MDAMVTTIAGMTTAGVTTAGMITAGATIEDMTIVEAVISIGMAGRGPESRIPVTIGLAPREREELQMRGDGAAVFYRHLPSRGQSTPSA